MPVGEVPTTDIDLGSLASSQDPYPVMHTIRELGPVVYNPSIDRYLVASYEHARKVLGDQSDVVGRHLLIRALPDRTPRSPVPLSPRRRT